MVGIDMEMPTCCVTYTSENDNYIACPFYKICEQRETIKTNYKPTDCPLVETEERKVGKWVDDCGFIDKNYRKYECSNCGESVYEKPYQIKYHKYCLHCGSRNEVE